MWHATSDSDGSGLQAFDDVEGVTARGTLVTTFDASDSFPAGAEESGGRGLGAWKLRIENGPFHFEEEGVTARGTLGTATGNGTCIRASAFPRRSVFTFTFHACSRLLHLCLILHYWTCS